MSKEISASILSLRERRRARQGNRHGEQGFTLVEMLVVVTIMGLVMALIGPRVINYLSESKVKAARIQLRSFSGALDLFNLDAGRYPSTAEGLAALVRRMPVPETVLEAIIKLVRSARPEQTDSDEVKNRVEWGPSPRAGQALMLAARSRALLRGRLAPSLDDVEALAEPALGHRMSLAYDPTGTGGTLSELIAQLANKVV